MSDGYSGLRLGPILREPIGHDEPMGKFDEHTIFGAIWRYWGSADRSMLMMMRGIFDWKIEPIEDEE